MGLLNGVPFILEMEAYHEDYNSSKCASLVRDGQLNKLKLAVFNYIILSRPTCKYAERFNTMAEIDNAGIDGIFRAKQYDEESFSDFMIKSISNTEEHSYIEGAVLWDKNEIYTKRGDIVKVKHSQTLTMKVEGITLHMDGNGINISCTGKINGVDISAKVPIHGDKIMKKTMVDIYKKSQSQIIYIYIYLNYNIL